MDLIKAEEILADLTRQLDAAKEQQILLMGAVQGAQAVINALKEDNGKNSTVNKRNRKRTA